MSPGSWRSVPQTRQQVAGGPFPLFDRKAHELTATGMTDYQPSPIPATNGHAPTVIGRTQTMFSPVKAITVGALVFAIGGTFLIAQPFGQQGDSVPGAQSAFLPGVEVTVTQTCDFPVCTWTASDPRLTGASTIHYGYGGGITPAVGDDAFEWWPSTHEGPEGSWTGHVYIMWGEEPEPTQNFLVLSGAGAYEGWQFVASSIDPESDGDFDWTGVLYEGELPPYGPLAAPTAD